MEIYEVTAVASAIVIITGLIWYIWLVANKEIDTVVASWIVSTTALALSLVTYFTSPKANVIGGTLNAASVCAVGGTLIAVYLRSKIDGQKLVFLPFHINCLKFSAFITFLWVVMVSVGGTGTIPNWLTQAMLVISYGMLIKKFWNAEKNTESLFTWWCVLVSSVIGLYTAHAKHDPLAMIYAIRSTVMCGILIYALHRISWRHPLKQK